ncbi:MAG: hypothetical protein ACI835_000185 [Planctomycetota bacterium]|jgi:hypothetical protein
MAKILLLAPPAVQLACRVDWLLRETDERESRANGVADSGEPQRGFEKRERLKRCLAAQSLLTQQQVESGICSVIRVLSIKPGDPDSGL